MKGEKKFSQLLSEVWREWKWLFRYIRKYRWGLVFNTLSGLAGAVMGLGSSIASKRLIDAVVGRDGGALALAASLVIGLTLSEIFFQALTSRISAKIGTRVSSELRGDFYEHAVCADWNKISSYHSGELINRLEGDVASVSNGIVGFIPGLAARSAQFFGALAIVLYNDPTMALLALLGAPVVFFSSRFMVKKIRRFNQESRDMNGRIISSGEESLQNLQTIKAFDLTSRYVRNFRSLLASYREVRLNYDRFQILMTMCLSLVGLLVSLSCYGWGVWRLWQGAITFGTMTLFIQLSSSLTASFSALASMAPTAVSVATSAGRLKELSELPPEPDGGEDISGETVSLARETGLSIRAEKLTFTYPGSDSPVLKDADFSADPGDVIAVVGPSGLGKTTMLRLLLGLLKPDSGNLCFLLSGGRAYPASRATRKFCAYVPQGNSIFSGSIAENLRLAAPGASDEELSAALKRADALDFVSALPRGAYSEVGERGASLSEGQAQRIAAARALLRRAPVLLMDEATSALDADTEDRLLRGLIDTGSGQICILTTHRPGVLKYCTKVYRIGSDGGLELITPAEAGK
ncbi:MAG: ABC transporter ATP-binding protein [Clostridiales bacterium]|nr:ABC transporter ATP-binding protein [Clostridiales bacterium]